MLLVTFSSNFYPGSTKFLYKLSVVSNGDETEKISHSNVSLDQVFWFYHFTSRPNLFVACDSKFLIHSILGIFASMSRAMHKVRRNRGNKKSISDPNLSALETGSEYSKDGTVRSGWLKNLFGSSTVRYG